MPSDAVDQVRERVDIVDLIGEQVQLQKSGRNFKGLCPFHQEKTPSFIVFPDSQNYHCFGCGAGGDVFNFVMQHERADFRTALETLAKRAGVELEQAQPRSPQETERHARLYEVNQRAAAWFSHVLWNSKVGEIGRALLERRGVDRPTAERFGLGFAPERWDALLTYLSGRGITVDEAVDAGLATRRDDGGVYDRFRGRLLFPIWDREGRVVGFGGRAMGDAQPKYLNTAQTVLFDKGSILYALHLAQEEIRRTREVVVVEGYMDAIAAHQFGFANVVASMGTALTDRQASLLRRNVDRIILALDADAAGQMATIRGLDVLRQSLSDSDRPTVDPVGLVRFERTLKVDIRIVRLPAGKDPDELIRKDVDAWRQALAEPVPLLDFYLDTVIGAAPPSDPRQKSELLERIAPVLREVHDRVVQAHYVDLVASRLQINPRLVLTAPRSRSRRVLTPESPPGRRAIDPEEYLFRLILQHPNVLASLMPEIPEQDIVDARRLTLLRELKDLSPEQFPEALARLSDDLHDYAEQLANAPSLLPGRFPGQIRNEGQAALRRLRKDRHDYRMRQLLADIAAAEQERDSQGLRHNLELIDQLKSRYPEFYPGRSPYFRDARDPVG